MVAALALVAAHVFALAATLHQKAWLVGTPVLGRGSGCHEGV